ncbi:Arm DNA-binding domain-containing protein [Roseixanthobacter pseudopolyaromaticivorans]|uniref:Arm DNA-binding domain-containing protein n=1 Tax=Xanthobacteraceae TaxID=335928 RepID=UPI003728F018
MSELTDKELKNLKPRAKLYKVTDRDGMYAAVTATGVVSFRYQYRVSGRQEVLTFGRYSVEAARKLTRAPDALEYGMEVSLAEARSLIERARRQVERGTSTQGGYAAWRGVVPGVGPRCDVLAATGATPSVD